MKNSYAIIDKSSTNSNTPQGNDFNKAHPY